MDADPSPAGRVATTCAQVLAVKAYCGVIGAPSRGEAGDAVSSATDRGVQLDQRDAASGPKEASPRTTGLAIGPGGRSFGKAAWSRRLARSGPILLTNQDRVLPVRHDDRRPARYADVPAPVLFEFGHGLGYGPGCTLELREATATASVVRLRVRVRATRAGSDVIRVQLRRRGGRVWPNQAELISWRRITFAAGDEQDLTFEFAPSQVFAQRLAPLARAVTEIVVAGGSHSCPVVLVSDTTPPPTAGADKIGPWLT